MTRLNDVKKKLTTLNTDEVAGWIVDLEKDIRDQPAAPPPPLKEISNDCQNDIIDIYLDIEEYALALERDGEADQDEVTQRLLNQVNRLRNVVNKYG